MTRAESIKQARAEIDQGSVAWVHSPWCEVGEGQSCTCIPYAVREGDPRTTAEILQVVERREVSH